MLKAKMELSEKQAKLSLLGHAESAEHGKDIVCAAASMLACTLANVLRVMEADGELEALEIRLDPGDTEISAVAKPDFAGELVWSMYFCEVGYISLSRSYPQNVAFELKND